MKSKQILIMLAFFVLPASSNFKLEGFSLGSAGGNSIGSSNYSINAVAGELGNNQMVGNSYGLGAGLVFVEMAAVPKVIVDNPSNFYNKLHIVIDTQGNPEDTRYAVAISNDNFVTTEYVKYDGTIGSTLAFTDYQTYAFWGGAGGSVVSGLTGGTTYYFKAKAWQGRFSETGWGPVASLATEVPTLSFDIDIAATDVQTTPPYLVNFGDLYPASITDSPVYVWVSLETNAVSGANVFVYGQNGGLYSAGVGYTISSVNGDLTGVGEGYGIQGVGATQTAGLFTIVSPYDGGGQIVGSVSTTIQRLFTALTPITAGRARFLLKAKSSNDTPSASDFSEIMTVIASSNF